jgi:hypothetical protein
MRPLHRVAAFAAIAITAACHDVGTVPEARTPLPQPEGHDLRGPMVTGWVIGPDDEPMEVTYLVHEGRAIWQGDIDLGPANEIFRTSAAARSGGPMGPRLGIAIKSTTLDPYRWRWPSGKVPYVIQAGFPSPSRVTDAMAHIEANTDGVEFVPRTTESDYIEVKASTNCTAPVGRRGGPQPVELKADCLSGGTLMGQAVHELLHALGMYHEQSRCDRDTYVTINTANMLSGASSNFAKICSGARDYGSYDEGSIMHYAPTAWTSNGQPTITSKRGLDHLMGQRGGMSSSDRTTITGLYAYQPGPRSTIYTFQTPASTLDASPGWEVGTRFKSTRAGCVVGLRFYRAAGETGSNTVKLWSESGSLLRSATITGGSTGWNAVELRYHQVGPYEDLSVCIPTNTYYRVSVNTNTKQVKTPGAFQEDPIVSGALTADAGYYGQPTGSMPTTSSVSSFLVDVVFEENP